MKDKILVILFLIAILTFIHAIVDVSVPIILFGLVVCLVFVFIDVILGEDDE